MRNRVFFPQSCLDQWGVEGKIEVTPNELVVLPEGRRYDIVEVVYVVREVTGAADPHEIVGKVKTKAGLQAMEAEIVETSMIIGDNAYDIVPGWAGFAKTSYAKHLESPERFRARKGRTDLGKPPSSDEQMLKLFASGELL